MNRPTLFTITFALTLACTSAPAADDEAGTTTSPSSTDADGSSSDDATTSDDESTLGTSSSSDDEVDTAFIVPHDVVFGDPCDSFAQDCPEGEKCVPYASSGGTWDAVKCVPIQGAQGVGELCMYAGPIESTDDCDGTSWCWEGVCHAFCTGTPDMPECPPMSQCSISGDGTITICLPTCDPVIQDCPEETACYWADFNFNCIFTTQDIPTGEPCGYINDCAGGNACLDAAALPACDGSACCVAFCDLGLGDSQCAAVPETACVAFFEQGRTPIGYEHVGICILPPP